MHTLADAKNYCGARMLKAIAKEEAAKYLVLLDAVRCPRRNNGKNLSDQLKKSDQHLAKGIYAKVADWKPADFKEVRQGFDHLCEDYYLDGPNDVGWIFENRIIRQRLRIVLCGLR